MTLRIILLVVLSCHISIRSSIGVVGGVHGGVLGHGIHRNERLIEGASPVVLKVVTPCLDSMPDVHGSRASVGESAENIFQFDITDNIPGVPLGNPADEVDAIELEDLGTNFDELFVRSLVVPKVEGRCRGENCEILHKNLIIINSLLCAFINQINGHL